MVIFNFTYKVEEDVTAIEALIGVAFTSEEIEEDIATIEAFTGEVGFHHKLLPGLGKEKSVKPRKTTTTVVMENKFNLVSITISLEKFKCGSLASSTIISDLD
ncbi:hypothetical protein J1N35_022593 [Gossypium stocksii]|uniref:Uncharacterized protein n=1 Tax=Gossypium stocksii TaxID=47602 RepID=A0A9D3VI28_9ROSI|nr:hypothetical protein J1N35_022593 [Gossypium stocksii]